MAFVFQAKRICLNSVLSEMPVMSLCSADERNIHLFPTLTPMRSHPVTSLPLNMDVPKHSEPDIKRTSFSSSATFQLCFVSSWVGRIKVGQRAQQVPAGSATPQDWQPPRQRSVPIKITWWLKVITVLTVLKDLTWLKMALQRINSTLVTEWERFSPWIGQKLQ